MRENYLFEVFNIEKDKDWSLYKKTLSEFKFLNPFHYIELMESAGGTDEGSLHYFILSKNNMPLVLMPFFLRSIPINTEKKYYDISSPYGYSGPVYDVENEECLKDFWFYVDQWYRNNNIISEFIRFNINSNFKYYTGDLVPSLVNIKGKIHKPEILWDEFKAKVRNNYRRAVYDKLEYRMFYDDDINETVISNFYNIYISTMKRNEADSRYFYSEEYFLKIASSNKKNCAVAIVFKKNIPISTEFILLSTDTAYSYLGGTMDEYFNSRPNDFLKFNTMKWLYEHNINYYALGGGRKNRDGLFYYKKSFFPNDEDVIYYTGRKIINQDLYRELSESTAGMEESDENGIKFTNFFPAYRSNEVLFAKK